MSSNGSRDQLSDAPKFAVNDKSHTGQTKFGNTVFGVSAAEVSSVKNISHQGWIYRTVGTGGRVGRVHHEVLSVATIAGDAASFTNASSNTITSGTADNTQYP